MWISCRDRVEQYYFNKVIWFRTFIGIELSVHLVSCACSTFFWKKVEQKTSAAEKWLKITAQSFRQRTRR